ncbi:MAG: hypothetical protein AB7O84_15725 [Planctomycetota bacterium]
MATTLLFSLLVQQLTVQPYPCEVGQTAVVAAVAAPAPGAAPLPIAGLQLVVERADGSTRPLGSTDAAGRLEFVPEQDGLVHVAGTHGGERWVAPLQVVARPRRWLYAALFVPLGLALLVLHWRAAARGRPAG